MRKLQLFCIQSKIKIVRFTLFNLLLFYVCIHMCVGVCICLYVCFCECVSEWLKSPTSVNHAAVLYSKQDKDSVIYFFFFCNLLLFCVCICVCVFVSV